MNEIRRIANGLQFPEGPIAMSDGSILVVEVERGTLSRVSTSGDINVAAVCGGGPNGAAVGPDGRVYVCNNGGFDWPENTGRIRIPSGPSESYAGGSIQRVDLDSGTVEDLYTHCDGHRLSSPNDIVFDAHGGFYFTDSGKKFARTSHLGGLYYGHADGSSIAELVYPMERPNGIGLSAGGQTLYVTDTWMGRIWSWDIVRPGVLGAPDTPHAPGTLLYDFPGWQGVDGMAVDSEGALCVATLVTGAITVISSTGELRSVVKVPGDDPFVTNICFGGPDLQTAFITSSGCGCLYAMEWDPAGLPLSF